MTFDNYQTEARKTAIYSHHYCVMYPTLGLAGEVGEVANKIKKIYRDDNGIVGNKSKEEISNEIGDCLWYLSNLASDLGLTLEDIAVCNIEKLKSRKKRGVITGSGDNR